MVSPLDKVKSGLDKLKSLGDGKSSIFDREKIVRQLKIDLTFF